MSNVEGLIMYAIRSLSVAVIVLPIAVGIG